MPMASPLAASIASPRYVKVSLIRFYLSQDRELLSVACSLRVFAPAAIINSHSTEAPTPFLLYRGSRAGPPDLRRAGLFCDLSTGEFCPLRIPPFGMAAVSPADKTRHRGPNAVGDFAEPGGRGKAKTAPSHQSLQKRLHPRASLRWEGD
jgi:hypothetical protein